MKELIRKVLKESIKEKLQKRLEEDGLAETLNTLGLEIDEFSQMVNIPVKELVQMYNPFEKFFTDEEFQNSLLRMLGMSYTYEGIFANKYTLDDIVKFIIKNTVHEYYREKLSDYNGDWLISNTIELAYLKYSDWLENNKRFKKIYEEKRMKK